ncbi:MAG TPA: zinc ribbon domain-containing protein, partial [Firmicutes bacterium]|nr:zinc ribbon domain-containing protein [Bacillota bacterium]
MPIYEYKCSRCGRFDLEQSIKDKPLTACPTCGG